MKRRKKLSLSQILRKKTEFVILLFLTAFITVAIRTVWVVYGTGDTYKKRYLSQQTYMSNPIFYKRGDIKDRRGIFLAKSVMFYNLVLEPRIILSKEEKYRVPTVKKISEISGCTSDEINKIIDENPKSGYQILKRDIPYAEMKKYQDEIDKYNKRDRKKENGDERKFEIAGCTFESYYKREYPLNEVASDVVGYTNSGNVGEWGIEGYYNSKLNGRNGIRYGYFNSDMELEETEIEPKNGLNVVTTIDATAQKLTEDIIAKYQKREHAKNVGIVVMNPNNGEIYVMASDKGYDLNNPRKLDKYYNKKEIIKMNDTRQLEALNKIWRNYCVSDTFEPGSTFKPFTVAACLEQGVIKEKDKFYCDGKEKIADWVIHCVKREGHGMLTLSQSLEKSCNDVMMQISRKLGRKEFSRYQELFGIGRKTGIDLPGETIGISYSEERLNPVELATNSFGQGVSVTMVQMAAGFSSLINGGIYYKPHVVKELVNDEGVTVESNSPVILKKTVTKKTSDFIKKALYRTVEEGTGKRAQTKGYKIGGKTGTAQKLEKLNGRTVRSDRNYVLSFIGCVPYKNPEAVIFVVVDQPSVVRQDLSGAAMQLASEVISKTFKVIGIYPEEKTDKTKVDKSKGR